VTAVVFILLSSFTVFFFFPRKDKSVTRNNLQYFGKLGNVHTA